MHNLSGLRVLVVDDNPDVLYLLEVLFEEYAAEVKSCGSADDALAAVATWRPDVLVSDICMPNHDGYWLIRHVRSLDRSAGGCTPAVAVTAYTADEDRRRAIEAGFRVHVGKPFAPDDLVAAVKQLAALRDLDCGERRATA